jgi:hypothetical protein
MKTIIFTVILALSTALSLAQSVPVSLVPSNYPRDIPSESDPTDYSSVQYRPCFGQDIVGSPFTDYEGNTFPGLGEVSYYLATLNPRVACSGTVSQLRKPLIVLDGFDPGDSRSGNKIYGRYLKYTDNSKPANERDQFLGRIVRQGIDGQSSQQYDLMVLNFPIYGFGVKFTTVQCPSPFPGVCSQLGYPRTVATGDRIVDGGADYIERNALVLIKLIQQTNQTLQQNGSSEKIVIIGPSMGGLISRYALAYMEKQFQETGLPEWKHNCRLWLSFDSPHLGANIGIGNQQFLRFFGEVAGIGDARANLNTQIRSPAAKQMLIHHELSNSVVAQGAPGFRDRFEQALSTNGLAGSLGFPQGQSGTPLRKVALINGSISGKKFANACGQVLKLETFLSFKVFAWDIYTNTKVATADAFNAGSFGNACKTFAGYKYNQCCPDNWEDDFGASPATTDSYDTAPGGSFDVPSVLAGGARGFSDQGSLAKAGVLIGGIGSLINAPVVVGVGFVALFSRVGGNTNVSVYQPSQSFIPTKSSLAYRWNNRGNVGNFAEDLSSNALVCEGKIPFDTYFAPDNNEEHVFLTQAGASFALNEIKGVSQLPLVKPGYLSASANNIACFNPDATITVTAPPLTGVTAYNWSVSSGLQIVSRSGNQVVVKSSSLNTSTDIITETVNLSAITSCSQIVPFPVSITKEARCSSPTPNGSVRIAGPTTSPSPCNATVTWTAETTPAGIGTNFKWQYIKTTTTVPPTSSALVTFSNSSTATYSHSGPAVNFKIYLQVDLGGGIVNTTASAFFNACGSPLRQFVTSPNPSESEFTVEKSATEPRNASTNFAVGEKVNQAAVAPEVFEVQLFSPFGIKVRTGNSKDGKVSINTANLPNGVYALQIMQNGQLLETQQVVIVH